MGTIDYSSVRDIPPKTQGNRGIFPSFKVPEGSVHFESQIEGDFFLLLEHAGSVADEIGVNRIIFYCNPEFKELIEQNRTGKDRYNLEYLI